MHVRVMPAVLAKLGAVFNANKCNFSLSQRVLWHGHVFCSVVQVCSMPAEKVTKAVRTAAGLQKVLLRGGSLLVRMVA